MSSGKRVKKNTEGWNAQASYNLQEAVAMMKSRANAKFDETVDVCVMLGVDPRHSDQMVRGVVSMPNGLGKSVRVAVFAKGAKVQEALDAGADFVGGDDLVEQIQKGSIDFERCIATPDMMVTVGKIAKILGPKGLMPNPKLGTVTVDVATAVKAAKSGQVEFRVEKAGIVHAGVAKASFTESAIVENIAALIDALNKAKPSGAKGTYMKKVVLSSTMGPGVRVDVSSLLAA